MLRAPYSDYPDRVREFIFAHDHTSYHEFDLYRSMALSNLASSEDHHRGHAAADEMRKVVSGRRNRDTYLKHINGLELRLYPYTKEDAELFDMAAAACKGRKVGRLKQIGRLGYAIQELRSAKALNAPIALRESELNELPAELGAETETARLISSDLRKTLADGLGIGIPSDLPIEEFIELVKDYQPRIRSAIDAVALDNTDANLAALSKNISAINYEIERIKGLKRHVILEAAIGFYKNNALLVGGALIAATMGVAGSLLGCATASVVTAGAKLAKQKGWVKDNLAAQKFARMIVRDLQPYTDVLLRSYLGTTAPAVSVLSLRRRIKAASSRH